MRRIGTFTRYQRQTRYSLPLSRKHKVFYMGMGVGEFPIRKHKITFPIPGISLKLKTYISALAYSHRN